MKKLSFFVILPLVILLSLWFLVFAEDAPLVEWIAFYDSAMNGTDMAADMAMDSSGNVYVTGQSIPNPWTNWDYATVKFNSDGIQEWVERYGGPSNGNDYALAIAVDSSGNVYVTGYENTGVRGQDYATIKYDTNGNQLWVARYNGPANGGDLAYAIAVDSARNVYVTGSSYNYPWEWDCVTVKYDTNGNQLWVARYNGPANLNDRGFAIAVDTLGNVYVTGFSIGSLPGYNDFVTIKYDSNGNQLWAARYDGPANLNDWGYAISVSSSGNVYVAGCSTITGRSHDFTTIKYDRNGTEEWVRSYNGSANLSDEARAIGLDSSENVYVTGHSIEIGTGSDFTTVKYDSSGNQLWISSYNGPSNGGDEALALTFDSSGNVYVSGESQGTRRDIAVVKYNSFGIEQWAVRYNSPYNKNDYCRGVVVDLLRNVYVGGYIGKGTDTDYALVKYASPCDPPVMVDALIAKVQSFNLNQGIENSLDVKLANAKASLDSLRDGNIQDAINKLQAFVHECEAQSGKQLTEAQASELIEDSNRIIECLQ